MKVNTWAFRDHLQNEELDNVSQLPRYVQVIVLFLLDGSSALEQLYGSSDSRRINSKVGCYPLTREAKRQVLVDHSPAEIGAVSTTMVRLVAGRHVLVCTV